MDAQVAGATAGSSPPSSSTSSSPRATPELPTTGALVGRGRKEGPWAKHFTRLHERQSKSVYLSVCNFCVQAHEAAPDDVPPPRKLPARRASQVPHLKRCTFVPADLRADIDVLLNVYGNIGVPYPRPGKSEDTPAEATWLTRASGTPHAASEEGGADASSGAEQPPSKRIKTADKPPRSSPSNSVEQEQPYPDRDGAQPQPLVQTAASSQPPPQVVRKQLHMLVADVVYENGLPLDWVESATMKRLVRYLRPGLEHELPLSDEVGDGLLRRAVARAANTEESELSSFTKQGASVAVVLDIQDGVDVGGDASEGSTLMRAFLSSVGAVKCVDVRPISGGTDIGVLVSVVTEVRNVLNHLSGVGTPVGSVCLHFERSQAASRLVPARALLAHERPQLIVTQCFAHIANCLAGAVFQSQAFRSTVVAVAETIDAIVVPGDAPWQHSLRSAVTLVYGVPLNLARMSLAQWTSAHEAVASLLRVRSALQSFASEYKAKDRAGRSIEILRDDAFWNSCVTLEAVLRPLAAASFALMQRDSTMSLVFTTFLDLTQALQLVRDKEQQHALTQVVQSYWQNWGSQSLAYLAFLLHPSTRERAVNLAETDLTAPANVAESAIQYYRIFFGANEPTNKLRGDVMKWRNDALVKQIRFEEFDNWLSYWEYVRDCKIAVELARLAIYVLSAGVQSSDCEALLSHRRTSMLSRCGASSTSFNLEMIKDLALVNCGIDRKRREDVDQMKRSQDQEHAGDNRFVDGVASATELARAEQGATSTVNLSSNGLVASHSRLGADSDARSSIELGRVVDSWISYYEDDARVRRSQEDSADKTTEPTQGQSSVDTVKVPLVDLLVVEAHVEAFI